jgi:hypothetical protein
MSEQIKSEIISRRAFSFAGLAAAFGLAVPTTILTSLDAEAQTPGMVRRQERRANRRDRREDRRTNRQERREDRRTNRQDRRDDRRTTTQQ